MTKSELIRQAARRSHVTQETAGAIINEALKAVTEALRAGERVSLQGFGVIEIHERKPGIIRDFKTGECSPGKRRNIVSFSAYNELKEAVNGGR